MRVKRPETAFIFFDEMQMGMGSESFGSLSRQLSGGLDGVPGSLVDSPDSSAGVWTALWGLWFTLPSAHLRFVEVWFCPELTGELLEVM